MQKVLILSKAEDFQCRLFVTSVDSVLISKVLPMFIYLKFILWLQFYLSSGSPAWWAEHGSRNTINFLYLIWVGSPVLSIVWFSSLVGRTRNPNIWVFQLFVCCLTTLRFLLKFCGLTFVQINEFGFVAN